MKITLATIVLLSLACNFTTAQETKEPPLKYTIAIGDKSKVINADETTTIEGEFKNPKIRITPSPFREFPYMGVKFNYPSTLVFEADLSDVTSKSWTLTGNNLNVLLFEIAAEISTVEFANSMIGEFGAENAKSSEANIKDKFGNLELPGSRLSITIGSAKLQMDIFKLPSKAGKTKLVVFQDNIENGKHSKEGIAVMKQVKSTFKFLEN